MSSPRLGMHVLIAATTYPSRRDPKRGAFVYHFAQCLAERCRRLDVAAPTRAGLAMRQLARPPRSYGAEAANVYPAIYLAVPDRVALPRGVQQAARATLVRALTRIGARMPGRPDVVWAHFLHTVAAAVPLAQRFRAPLVASLGDSDIERVVARQGRHRAAAALQACAHIVAVSEEIAGYCRDEIGVPDGKVSVIPNGVNPEMFSPGDRGAARTALGLDPDAFYVVSVGAFIERKGPLRIASALDRLEGVKGLFLGAGPQQPAGSRVALARSVPPYDVPRYLAAADAFVLPTTAEGSCNAIAEAMAMGLPVITSDLDNIVQQVGPDNAIFVDPYDSAGMASAIGRLRDDPGLRTRLGERSLARARSAMMLPARVDRICEILRRVIGERSAREVTPVPQPS